MTKDKDAIHLKWLSILIIGWVLLYIIGEIMFSVGLLIIGFLFLFLGTIFTVFNKRLYQWMVQFNAWGFGKIGNQEMVEAVKSDIYRRFYRTMTFLVGIVSLVLGVFAIFLQFGIDLRSLI